MSLYNLELVVEGSEKLMIGKKLDKSLNRVYFYALRKCEKSVGKTESKKVALKELKTLWGKLKTC